MGESGRTTEPTEPTEADPREATPEADMNQAIARRAVLGRGLQRSATRRVTRAKVVLKPIGDNDPDYVIRSGLSAPPQATPIEISSGSAVVGRDEEGGADVIIPIPTVSGAHAKVELGKSQHQNESLLRFFLTLFRFLLVAEGEAL